MYYLFPWHIRYCSAKFRRDGNVVTAESSGQSGAFHTFLADAHDSSGRVEMVATSIYSHNLASLRYDVRGYNGKEFVPLSSFDNEGMAWIDANLYALAKMGVATKELHSRWTQTLKMSQEHCDAATRTDLESGLRYRSLIEMPRGYFLEKPCVVDAMITQGLPCFTNGKSVLYHLRREAGERIALISASSGKTMAIFDGPEYEMEALRALATLPYRGSDLSGHEMLDLHDASRRAEDLTLSSAKGGTLLGMGGFIPNACPVENLRLAV